MQVIEQRFLNVESCPQTLCHIPVFVEALSELVAIS
jgi:hypothetical protein